jgi:hypothetical protein
VVEPAPPSDDAVALVADPDAATAGRAVRAHLDAGRRAAGFVGRPDDPARAEFLADVVDPGS